MTTAIDNVFASVCDLELCYVSFPPGSRDGAMYDGAPKCFGVVFLTQQGRIYLPFSKEGNSYEAIVGQRKIGFSLGDFHASPGGELYGAADSRPLSDGERLTDLEEQLLQQFERKYSWLKRQQFTGSPRVIALEPYYLVWVRQEEGAMRESRWRKNGATWQLVDEKDKGIRA